MTTSPEIRAEVQRLYYGEHYSMHAVAKTVGIHHNTVKELLASWRLRSKPCSKSSVLDPYMPIIEEALSKYPRLRATRLLQMLRSRGYKGGVRILQDRVRLLRPQHMKAYMPLSFLPGEQAQVDWAHMGWITAENTKRRLSCFVMVLSHSRAMYARFTYDQTMESLLRCHVAAFRYFGGVSRIVLYDNMKTVVLARDGRNVSFNPYHLEFSGYYRFKADACNIRAGWEKGRVERSIRYIRDNFFAAREFSDLADANRQLRRWLDEYANKRPWPDDRSRSVFDVWQEETKVLMPLPEHDFAVTHIEPLSSGKLPYLRFDLNDYSIPYNFVGKTLSLVANEDQVTVVDGADNVIATHPRSYGKGKKVRMDQHFEGLLASKARADRRTLQERLVAKIPMAEAFFNAVIEQGAPLGAVTQKLGGLLNEYGRDAVEAAIHEAMARGLPRITTVAQILYETLNRTAEGLILPLDLPDRPNMKYLSTLPHDLASYDALGQEKREESPCL